MAAAGTRFAWLPLARDLHGGRWHAACSAPAGTRLAPLPLVRGRRCAALCAFGAWLAVAVRPLRGCARLRRATALGYAGATACGLRPPQIMSLY
ncbi:MAG: hypothetical protein A2Y63_00285 [Candidatus Riflebacteria bacterium RBG_13_59_9]|nr:MAG: hypothetical protein A2Y63_00285 [Candidatus Riflebacteria bacterium RBG_13_59_9]